MVKNTMNIKVAKLDIRMKVIKPTIKYYDPE